MNYRYKGQDMRVFHHLRVGRFRLVHAALESEVETIEAAWKNQTLKKLFEVRVIPDQVIGEEIYDSQGRMLAVFGAGVTNAFVPNQKPQQEYLKKLASVLSQTQKTEVKRKGPTPRQEATI
jgi:hypothetical protein